MNATAALFLALLTAATHAGPRTSASYTVATDTADAGGKRATSASYTNDGSMGGVTGISTVAVPAETLKAGYAAQLYDATALALTAATLNVNEGATLQLAAFLALDDATFLTVPTASVAWSVMNGPLTINSTGLATGGVVFQNTAATAQGIHLGTTGTLGLTVANTLPDNFGTYAADGLDDDWQNQYFGLNNANAAPALDPDGDGQTNNTEWLALTNPANPNSRFTVTTSAITGNNLPYSFASALGRNYTVEYSTDLTAPWQTAAGTIVGTGAVINATIGPVTGFTKYFIRIRAALP